MSFFLQRVSQQNKNINRLKSSSSGPVEVIDITDTNDGESAPPAAPSRGNPAKSNPTKENSTGKSKNEAPNGSASSAPTVENKKEAAAPAATTPKEATVAPASATLSPDRPVPTSRTPASPSPSPSPAPTNAEKAEGTPPPPSFPATIRDGPRKTTIGGKLGVLAAMQAARNEERRIRATNAKQQFHPVKSPPQSPGGISVASSSSSTTAQDSNDAAPEQVKFTRRTYPAGKTTPSPPQFTRRNYAAQNADAVFQRRPRLSDKSTDERDTPPVAATEEQSIACSLEEARKKLAALRGGAPGGAANCQEQPLLAPNPNDPRLRKHYSPQSPSNNINNNNNNSSNNNIMAPLLGPPLMRTPSPIPPPPSMKPSNWISFSNIPVNVSPTAPGSQSFRSFERDPMPQTQSQHQRYNGLESRDPRSRPPHQSAPHQQQQPQPQPYASMAAYSGNPRRPANGFGGFDDTNWHSAQKNANPNIHANGNGNGFNASSWNGQTNGTASGFNGSGSFRGNPSYRGAGRGGGHPNRHFVRPGAVSGDVPRTYKEHREAKARADAMAKARAEEELRRLEAERQRLLEAADKEDGKERERERELGAAATAVPELQLDTSYRNCTVLGGPAKKIDFRIPKKTPAPATTPNPVNGEADGAAGNSNKACDAKKDRDKEAINNSKDTDKSIDTDKARNKDNANEDEDVERETEPGKGSKKKTGKSKPQKEPEKKSSKRKRNRKRNKKNVERDAAKKVPPSGNRDFGDAESVVSLVSSENTDNLENEPPAPENNASPTTELPQEAQSQNEASSEDDDDIFARLIAIQKKKTSVSEGKQARASEDKSVSVKDAEEREDEDKQDGEENAQDSNEDKATTATDEDKPPKLSKMKIVLGPNAHAVIIPSEHSDSKDKIAGKSGLMVFDEEHDDEEVPGPTVQELKRIMQRRNSMAPTASKPLVDKEMLFTGRSLVYEDLQEQDRKNRNLANLFERTSDNCRVSTQNIISGKRRTRGGQENFNETTLSRNIFGLGQITRAKRGEAVRKATSKEDVRKTDDNKSAKSIISSPGGRKRRRKTIVREAPANTENEVPDEKPVGDISEDQKDNVLEKTEVLPAMEVDQKKTENPEPESETDSETESDPSKKPRLELEVAKICALVEVQTEQQPSPATSGRQKPRRKRNELDKLNEDIAQMYYGEEVLRATGRRACTKRPQARARTRTRSRTLSSARSSSSQAVSPLRDDTESTSKISPQNSKDDRLSSPFFIRNMARRGKAFGGPKSLMDGISRATLKSKILKVKNVRVRIPRCLPLEKMIKQQTSATPQSPKEKPQEETPQAEANTSQTSQKEKPANKKKKRQNNGIKNVNPEWHAQSAAVSSCVICDVPIRQSPTLHYLLKHQEHFAARLSPEMLQELRNGRNAKADYKMHRGNQKGMFYHFVCPFCMKPLMMRPPGLADHLAYHMGEARFSCSHCRLPNRNRIAQLMAHTKKCAPGAEPLINPSVSRMPLNVHVCHLCQFVQIEKRHLDNHLIEQHGLAKEEVEDLEVEQLTICRVDDVPHISSPAEANAVMRKNRTEGCTSRTEEKAATKKKDKGKKAEKVKQERVEQETQSEPEAEEESRTHPAKVEVDAHRPELQLPLPPPEKETVLVVNECLMDVDEDSAAEDEVEVEAEVEAESSQQNMSLTVDQKPVMLVDNRIIEDAAPSKSKTNRDQPAPPPDISLSELNGDLLDGIGSDESDIEDQQDKASAALGKTNEDDDEGALTDEWVDLETANAISRSRKSIFYNFNRLCTILNKGGNSSRSGGRGGTSIGSNDTSSDVLEVEAERSPDPSELLPSMRPLEPPETVTILGETPIEGPDSETASVEPPTANTTVPTPVAPVSGRGPIPAPPKRQVENVAFRMWSADGSDLNRRAYYCMQPGCTFLFSSELEGLEAHFMLEHPTVHWSGTCVSCPGRQETSQSPLTIAEELRHMLNHISQKSPTKEAADPAEAAPPALPLYADPEPETLEPVVKPVSASDPVATADPTPAAVAQEPVLPAPLPKLRVRRFTGDRLIEPAATGGEGSTEVVTPQLDPQEAINNQTLRDLLLAEPRPPNQVEFNTAGLGEFLVAKPTTPPVQVLQGVEPTAAHPVVINYQSGLGLSISQVYSGAHMDMDAVTLPVDAHPSVDVGAPASIAPPPPPLPAPMVELNRTNLEQLPGPESVSQQIREVFNQRRNQRVSITALTATAPSTETSQPLAMTSTESSLLSQPLALSSLAAAGSAAEGATIPFENAESVAKLVVEILKPTGLNGKCSKETG